MPKLDALIIRKEPLAKILAGTKTWEIRGTRCNKRGLIGLIESKSGTVVGTAELVACHGPLTLSDINMNLTKIGASRKLASEDELYYRTTYAWELKNVKRLSEPIPYNHKPGAVIWHPVTI